MNLHDYMYKTPNAPETTPFTPLLGLSTFRIVYFTQSSMDMGTIESTEEAIIPDCHGKWLVTIQELTISASKLKKVVRECRNEAWLASHTWLLSQKQKGSLALFREPYLNNIMLFGAQNY